MKLYDCDWAPNPRRVRIYLAEKGIKVDLVPVDLRANEQQSDAYLAINPRGTVPALQFDDGEVIAESVAICRYFEARRPDPPLFGATPIDIARIEHWTRRVEQEGYAAAVYALRNSSPRFEGRGAAGKWPPIPVIPALAERGHIMWGAFADALDGQLGRQQWVAGDAFSFADITALVTLDFAARAGLQVPPGHSNIARWHAICAARPSAKA